MESTIDLKQLATLIKDIKFCMFSTVSADGTILSRPMANQDVDANIFDGQLWFFTKKDTAKVHAIENDAHVNLAYASPDDQKYISIAGRASLNDDREKIKELWTPVLKAWFPEGVEDPEICLIAVDIQSALIWDAPPSKVVQAAGYVKAMVTGRPMDQNVTSKHLDMGQRH